MPFVDDDFTGFEQAMPLAAGNHPRFNWAVGSPEVMQFIAGVVGDVELAPGNGGGWLAYYIEPSVGNVAVECTVYAAASGYPATAKMGVFCRFADIDNYVFAVVDLNTGRLEVGQRVGGTTTTLANPTPTLEASEIKGASLKLEVVGRICRYWLNPRFYRVDDSPPDGTVDLLTDPDPDNPGEWGIFAQSNSSGTTFRAAHFYARELPNVTLPPPFIRVSNAASKAFVPITASVSSVPLDALSIEWELAPADPDDFAEVYRDVGPVALTSRVLWGRAGYDYDVRARAISVLGVRGDWTKMQRITASGTRVGPTQPTFPDTVFPSDIAPDWALEHTQSASVSAVVGGTNRERITATPGSPRPRRRWTLQFTNRQREDIDELKTFCESVQGMVSPFQWEHPTSGELIPARLGSDEPQVDIVDEGEESPVFDFSIDLIEVVVGGTATIEPTFALDASF